MFSPITLLVILLTHFLADFCFQTHEQAINKSSSNQALAEHVFTYAFVFALVFGFKFAAITAVLHFITDWNTSRVTKHLYTAGDTHMFFVVVGFDQVLHYVQLCATLLWLNGTAVVL